MNSDPSEKGNLLEKSGHTNLSLTTLDNGFNEWAGCRVCTIENVLVIYRARDALSTTNNKDLSVAGFRRVRAFGIIYFIAVYNDSGFQPKGIVPEGNLRVWGGIQTQHWQTQTSVLKQCSECPPAGTAHDRSLLLNSCGKSFHLVNNTVFQLGNVGQLECRPTCIS